MARNITSLQGGQHAENAGEQEFIQIVRLSTDTLPGTTDDNTLYMTPSTISNSVEITGAVFTETGNLANSAGSRTLRITGDEGAVASIEYSTGASGASSATLTATGADGSPGVEVPVTIAAQAAGTSTRTITATVTPGTSDPETVLAGGVDNFQPSLTQLAGPPLIEVTWNMSGTFLVSSTSYTYSGTAIGPFANLDHNITTRFSITGNANLADAQAAGLTFGVYGGAYLGDNPITDVSNFPDRDANLRVAPRNIPAGYTVSPSVITFALNQ